MVSVLVVDDEASARTLLAMTLRDADVSVEVASNGTEALKMVNARQFDWIICDVRLPDMNGIALVERILRLRPETRIVLISAVIGEDEVQNLPIAGFWRKPLDPLALRRFILNSDPPRSSRHERFSGLRLPNYFA